MSTRFLLETKPLFPRPFTLIGAGSSIFLFSRFSLGSLLVDRLAYHLGVRFHYRRSMQADVAERRNLVLIKPRIFSLDQMTETIHSSIEPLPKNEFLLLHSDVRFPLGWSNLYGMEHVMTDTENLISEDMIENIRLHEKAVENNFPHDNIPQYGSSGLGLEWIDWIESKQGTIPRYSLGVNQKIVNQKMMSFDDYSINEKAVRPVETFLRNKFPVPDVIRLKTHLADQLLVLTLKTRFGVDSEIFKELSSYIPVHNPIMVYGF